MTKRKVFNCAIVFASGARFILKIMARQSIMSRFFGLGFHLHFNPGAMLGTFFSKLKPVLRIVCSIDGGAFLDYLSGFSI